MKSSRNRKDSKNCHVDESTSSNPVPVFLFFFFFLSRPNIALNDLILAFYVSLYRQVHIIDTISQISIVILLEGCIVQTWISL